MFPQDFNGIIAGDPYLGSQYAVQHLKADFGFLKPPVVAFLPASAFPYSIIATHYTNNTSDRTMPLCPFPTEATYLGGPVNQASSWSCEPNEGLLQVGYDGILAGVNGEGIGSGHNSHGRGGSRGRSH